MDFLFSCLDENDSSSCSGFNVAVKLLLPPERFYFALEALG